MFRHLAVLLAVAAALTLPGLGATSLWDIDEGLNAEAAREMLESGDWVVPQFNFKPRTAKPALTYWLQATSYRAFGVNEFAARFPSALATALTALLVYDLGRRMFSPAVGLLAGVMLLSTVQVCLLAHAATPDAVLCLSLTLTFWLFWIGSRRGGRLWLWTCGFGCGLALLAKGPVGIVMPAAVIGYFLLARREFGRLFDRRLLGGLALMLLVAGPWYALVGAQTHGAFLKAFLTNENLNRFTAPMEGHRGPVVYYLGALLVGFAPWCVVIGATLWDSLRSVALRPERSEGSAGDSPRSVTFLLCWLAVYLGFFSAAQTKLPNYVLPVYPPLALLAARTLERWRLGAVEPPRAVVVFTFVGLVIVGVVVTLGCLIGGGVLFPALIRKTIPGLAGSAWVGLMPMAVAVAAGWLAARERRTAALATFAAGAVAFLGIGGMAAVGAVESQKAPRELVARANACRPTDEVRIGCFEYFQPSLVFYVQREVTEFADERETLDFLRGPLPGYLVCPATTWERLAPRAAGCRALAVRRDLYRGFDVAIVGNRNTAVAVAAASP